MGPHHFILGSVCPSPKLKVRQPVWTSCGLANILASVEYGCPSVRAPAGHFACTSLALERKGKEALRTDSQCLASLRAFSMDELKSHNGSVRCPGWSLTECTCKLHTTCPLAKSNTKHSGELRRVGQALCGHKQSFRIGSKLGENHGRPRTRRRVRARGMTK